MLQPHRAPDEDINTSHLVAPKSQAVHVSSTSGNFAVAERTVQAMLLTDLQLTMTQSLSPQD